jgi:endonuclease/exonuclease/phosphatase family metal-dependent hydrolase
MRLRPWLAALAATCLAATAASAAEPTSLRLMTYNIRLDLASDGINAWPNRRPWVVAQVQWLQPDLFGMQEVQPNQKAELIADLPGYRIFGGGRDDGKDRGEASPIGYDTTRFAFRGGGTFWLSPTPDVPSKGWDAALNRVATWARLEVRGTRHVVLAVNTHWDHIGAVARKESAAQIGRWIAANARRCEHVVLLGDFNTEIDSEPLKLLRASPGLHDARAVSKSAPFGPAGTFNGFKNPPDDSRAIDHFLLGGGIQVDRYLVLSQIIDGRWPSDHFPVVIDVILPECRKPD